MPPEVLSTAPLDTLRQASLTCVKRAEPEGGKVRLRYGVALSSVPIRRPRTVVSECRVRRLSFDGRREGTCQCIRVTGFMECGGCGHSGLMLAARITLPHFSVSAAMSLPKSAGEPGSTVPFSVPRSPASRKKAHRRPDEKVQ